MSKAFSNRKLRLESLENRELFAGDVFAAVSNGSLYVFEATSQTGQPQAIEISKAPFDLTGQVVRVKGIPNSGGGTTLINGASFKDFRVPTRNVNVNLASGNDWVNVNNVNLNRIDIETGSGRDVVNFGKGLKTTGTVNVRMGADYDFVNLNESQIGNDSMDNLNVYMGTGDDYFFSRSTNQIGYVRGHLNLYMSENDLDRDRDTVTIEKLKVGNNLTMHTGAGNDTISVNNAIVGNDLLINTGADSDTATLKDVQVLDDLFANMGAGVDTLDLDNVWADRIEANGGMDHDTLIRRRVGQVNVFQHTGFELFTI